MKPKEIIHNVIDFTKRKLGRKKDGDYYEEESSPDGAEDAAEEISGEEKKELGLNTDEGKQSYLKGDHGKIFGVSRPIVIGIGVFFLLVFSLAFFYASSDTTPKKADNKNQQQTIADESTANATQAGKLPDDYAKLRQAEASKYPKGKPTTGQTSAANGGQSTGDRGNTVHAQRLPASSTVGATPAISTVPRASIVAPPASYASSYRLPSQEPSYSAPAAPARTASSSSSGGGSVIQKVADAAKEKFNAAIAFFGGEDKSSGSGGSSDGGSTPASSGGSAAPASSGGGGATYTAPAENTIVAGTTLPLMLMTGISTDSPGVVYAQVLADVYDSMGMNLMIPAGSQLIGSCSGAANDSGRVPVTFSQLVTPDGGSWAIGNSIVAGDGAGYIGIQGVVHRHSGDKFRQGLFNGAITALASAAADRLTLTGDALSALTDSTTFQNTVTVDPGYTFNAYVTQNIAF